MFFPLKFSSSFLHLFQSVDVRRNETTAKITTIDKSMANQHVFQEKMIVFLTNSCPF